MTLDENIKYYSEKLQDSRILEAYRGIMSFMSELKRKLEKRNPDFDSGSIYQGYMDMTYFPIIPPELKKHRLKIAVVYLHGQNRFDIWLSAANRSIQKKYIELLEDKDIGELSLSEAQKGVDSIIEKTVVADPDFDSPEELMSMIEKETVDFSKRIKDILE